MFLLEEKTMKRQYIHVLNCCLVLKIIRKETLIEN